MGTSKDVRHRAARIARTATAELLAGGRFRVEQTDRLGRGILSDLQRRFGGKRWRSETAILQPGETLVIDPRHLPEGTEIGIMQPERLQSPLELWLTYKEAGVFLLRSPKTVRNLASKHRLPRRTFWDGRGKHRRRMTLLPPATARRLAELSGKAFLIRVRG